MITESKAKLDQILQGIYNVTEVDIKDTRKRKRNIIDCKRIYFYLAKEKTHYTLNDIAKYIGMDHATVLHHHRKCKDLIEYDKEFKDLFNNIYDNLPFATKEGELRSSAANHLIKYRYYKNKLNNLKLAS